MYESQRESVEKRVLAEAERIKQERALDEQVQYEMGVHGALKDAPFGKFGHGELGEMRTEKADLFAQLYASSKEFRERVDVLDFERQQIEQRLAEVRDQALADAPLPTPMEVLEADYSSARAIYLERNGVADEKKLRPSEAAIFARAIKLPYLQKRAALEMELAAAKETPENA